MSAFFAHQSPGDSYGAFSGRTPLPGIKSLPRTANKGVQWDPRGATTRCTSPGATAW
jgi:hypothetical protein